MGLEYSEVAVLWPWQHDNDGCNVSNDDSNDGENDDIDNSSNDDKLGRAYCPVEHLSAGRMQPPSTTEGVLRRTKRDPVSFVGMAFSVMAVISWILLR